MTQLKKPNLYDSFPASPFISKTICDQTTKLLLQIFWLAVALFQISA